jgi:flagellar biosynthesis protein
MHNDENKQMTKAVAVKKSAGGDSPVLTAKGEGQLAEKLLDIAFAEGIKVRQDKDLTELLSAFDIESPVPLEALHAVSLILERVYAENQKMHPGEGRQQETDSNAGENTDHEGS